MKGHSILLVDDDPFILTGIGQSLETEGYRITTAESGELALELMKKTQFDLVITDLVMDRIDGIQVLKKAKEINSDSMVIILTGYGDMTSAIDALRLNADDYMLKPCQPDEMSFRVAACLEKLDLSRKIRMYEQILPVCCVCRKIRDDEGRQPGTGQWMNVDHYLWKKAGLSVSSTYCPECARKAKSEIHRIDEHSEPSPEK
ncbi:MAG: response regulator receiver protein [Deltaproteobacteria bacterium SG8_13]|nr:MAG: response regulator receiver protein [Deltaproteobacteria bacterium SG8_13]